MNDSIWVEQQVVNYKKLNKNISVDVLVVGGGICGVLCAYYLKKRNVNVVLVEKNQIGHGITKNTTAVLSSQQQILYKNRVEKVGFNSAKKYYEAHQEAIKEFKKLSENFEFDFEENMSFIYSKRGDDSLKKEYELLKRMGIETLYTSKNYESLGFYNQAQINPFKLIKELCQEIKYYENTEIIDINDNIAYTPNYCIKANKIVICTHFPFFKFKGGFSFKMYQMKSYVVAIKTSKIMRDSYVELKEGGFYFRRYKDMMLIGSNDQKTGCMTETYANIMRLIVKVFPDYKIIKKWSNQDCITLDDMPYIGKYRGKNEYYVATGFNMWGMTSSMISAQIISDLIVNGKSKYAELFDPYRKTYKKQLFSNVKNALKNLLKFNGKRCTHLGCSLTFNKEENVYECPCHGSKFTADGLVIYNPAKKNIKK